jgi:hypothetical protein
MLLSRQQNAGQNRDMKIANRSFENVTQLKYLGMTVKNQNLIREEIKGEIELQISVSTVWSGTFCLLACCINI